MKMKMKTSVLARECYVKYAIIYRTNYIWQPECWLMECVFNPIHLAADECGREKKNALSTFERCLFNFETWQYSRWNGLERRLGGEWLRWWRYLNSSSRSALKYKRCSINVWASRRVARTWINILCVGELLCTLNIMANGCLRARLYGTTCMCTARHYVMKWNHPLFSLYLSTATWMLEHAHKIMIQLMMKMSMAWLSGERVLIRTGGNYVYIYIYIYVYIWAFMFERSTGNLELI